MSSTTTGAAARRTLTAAACLALTVTLAGCGTSTVASTTTDAGSAPSTSNQQPDTPATGDGARLPGANGEVVAVSGRTAQVRNDRTGQVAVTWTTSTVFTATRAGGLSDLSTGDCVLVRGGSDGAAASTVVVSKPVAGECQAPGVGRPAGGNPPEGFEPPEGMEPPDGMDRPEGAPDRGEITAGKLTAITGTTLTVDDTRIEVASDATVTLPTAASAAALKTGVCVTARGETDSTGAVTAEEISIAEKVDGQCGFGGGFRAGQGGAPGTGPESGVQS